jgi:hypothetical protein
MRQLVDYEPGIRGTMVTIEAIARLNASALAARLA